MTRTTDEQYVTWKSWDSPFGTVTPEDRVYFAHEFESCGVGTLSGARVLELGFGNGPFAGWVRAQGAHWFGIERNAVLIERARNAGFEASEAAASLCDVIEPNSTDIVVALDVLEHMDIDAIRAFLGTAKIVLQPGGLVIGRMPSGDSPFSGSIFRGDLTHRTLLGSTALRQLVDECGLETVSVRETAFPVTGLGLRRTARRAAVSYARAVAYSFIRHVMIGERTAVVSPNMTFVLQKP